MKCRKSLSLGFLVHLPFPLFDDGCAVAANKFRSENPLESNVNVILLF